MKYRVSLTERVTTDWVVEVEANSEEEARQVALDTYYTDGVMERQRDGEIDIDWADVVDEDKEG